MSNVEQSPTVNIKDTTYCTTEMKAASNPPGTGAVGKTENTNLEKKEKSQIVKHCK